MPNTGLAPIIQREIKCDLCLQKLPSGKSQLRDSDEPAGLQQKYASSGMGTKRRKFPFQPMKETGDVSTSATLELIIKERREIQKERI